MPNVLSSDDPIAIHSRFLDIAEGISRPLVEALNVAGPISIPEREDNGLGYFLSRAVIGQQLSAKAARSIWAKVASAALSAGVGLPQYFDDNSVEALRACGVSRNKVKALRSLYDADCEGFLCGKTLCRLGHDARSQQLLIIWGIGQWTCDMASIFYCRCPDIWPEGDVAVQKTFGRLIGRRNPTKSALLFAPFRSYLALSMWQFVDAAPQR
jgi:DNA-3-methyladenine glycosylase II